MPVPIDPQWYKRGWTLDIQDMSWVERTGREVDFLEEVLRLQRRERILDLACGFGRHALELARRGHSVVGVDITPAYIEKARTRSQLEQLDDAEFICADLREVSFYDEFDVVLNLADGAIGYLEDEEENLKIFDLIASALKFGGQHLMGVCNGNYARKHFPSRHWEIGSRSVSLADFQWDGELSRMVYRGHVLKFGEVLIAPQEEGLASYTRLYTLDELCQILGVRGMAVRQAYGDYDTATPASDDLLTLLVHSEKVEGESTLGDREGRPYV